MRSARLSQVLGFSLLILIALPARTSVRAQDAPDVAPAHIAFVDGAAMLDRDTQTEPAAPNVPIVPGDRLRTSEGRVEVLFPDGSALGVDENTSVEVQAAGLLRVTSGRVLLVVARPSDLSTPGRFQVDTPAGTANVEVPGEYRIAVLTSPSGTATEMAVQRGAGTLANERGIVSLGAGERSVAWESAAPSNPQTFNSARFDAFDRWAAVRRDERRGSSQSSRHLPPDLRVYGGVLDRAGTWEEEAAYGYVWYPTVAAEWRPYYDGYWSSIEPYGWTWIGIDRWAWPTHHYGRWGSVSGRWFWIPDRRWAPAWVSWGAAPGYVSWCPLGFDNRPVFAFSASFGTSRAGWVVMSRSHFGGSRHFVRQHAVSPGTLPHSTPFVAQTTPPLPPPRAVPRRLAGSPSASSPSAARRSAAGPGVRSAEAGTRLPSGNSAFRTPLPSRERAEIGNRAPGPVPAAGHAVTRYRAWPALSQTPPSPAQTPRSSQGSARDRSPETLATPSPPMPSLPASPAIGTRPAHERDPSVSPRQGGSFAVPRETRPAGGARPAEDAGRDGARRSAPRDAQPSPPAGHHDGASRRSR